MRSRWLLVILGGLLALVGCNLFTSAADDDLIEEPVDASGQEFDDLLSDIEELRGRELPESLAIEVGQPSQFVQRSVPPQVIEEWHWFDRFIFGDAGLALDSAVAPFSDLAAVGEEATIVVSDSEEVDAEQKFFAFGLAANRVLERDLLGGLESPQTVDQWLSRQIIEQAGPAFATSMIQARRAGIPMDEAGLADRPELAVHIPVVGEQLGVLGLERDPAADQEAPQGVEFFDEALRQLVLRKALSVGATLYRAGEWPAVEWGRSEPPVMTQYLVRPESWFDGDGASSWEWATEFEEFVAGDGWQPIRQGSVGPAMTALWLEGLVGTRAARTIFGGWRADNYRVYERGDEEQPEYAFSWVSAWETPHDAQQIAAAVEAVLGHYLGHEHRERRFRVAVRGLNVAVVIHESDHQLEVLDESVDLLARARVSYLPDDPAPFSFVPTMYDRYVQRAEKSTLDLQNELWIDTAAGWRAELDSLEGWTVQRSNEAHVRWFATHTDGTLIQWTTELVDPLRASFGSEDYLDRLSRAFAESVSAQEEPRIEVVDLPVEPTIEMEIMGLIEGRPLALRLWQWRRGDVLVSFSVQGPESFFAERLSEVEAILGSLEAHGEPIERRRFEPTVDPGEDEGIIEFRVDDE